VKRVRVLGVLIVLQGNKCPLKILCVVDTLQRTEMMSKLRYVI
jgi:hypothetical protein